ncbi:MAG: hypothetical protein ACREKH_12030 [Candidatus Rokuibacteriota bacterium]
MTPSLRSAGAACVRRRPSAAGLIRVVLVFLALVRAAGAQTPPCVSGCDACLDAPCTAFDECKELANELYQSPCLQACRPPGKFPSFEAGRCTIIGECVDKCRQKRAVNLQDCRQSLRSAIRADCGPGGPCRIGSNAAKRLCRDCSALVTPTAAPITPLAATGSDCQSACVQRHAGDCFLRCTKACGGDRDATRLCGEGCGDANCNLLIRKCTVPDDPDDTAALAQRDPRYLLCCGADFENCDEDDAESIACEATTTSTTVTSTTRTTSTTSTTSTLPGGSL